ncbi:MAG TPA: hypothetical protein VGU61_10165 [Noviherbaspirillum sp.]|jgi:hypothetical protein|uniref:hypothetical protein n=1 Tax=Noviherbaspirillum sp. TaxID=1926288 RepID=UPI002DDD76C8|nr:hypothetical protein [Noviherbaspirillum sp.]HEV2610619.1 hypothetical protein [Noviherbaspirillum sp.]
MVSQEKMMKFCLPFPGKPVPIQLSGLMMLHPFVLHKLIGVNLRSFMSNNGHEGLYKRLEQVLLSRREPTRELLDELLYFLLSQGITDETINIVFNDSPVLPWRLAMLGSGWDIEARSNAFLLHVEKQCLEAQRLIVEKRFKDAAIYMASDPLLAQIVWPQALELLASAKDIVSIQPLQASLMLETQLGHIAAWDLDFCRMNPNCRSTSVRTVLPSSVHKGKNPYALYFTWLRNEIGAKTIDSFLDHKAFLENDLIIGRTTAGEWNRGSRYPHPSILKKITGAIFAEENQPGAWHLYWGARYLNLLGYMAERCTELAALYMGSEQERKLAPWPMLPFRYSNFEEWCQNRYQFWYDFHNKTVN